MSWLLNKYKFGCLLLCLVLSPIYIFAQDLGSSTAILKKPSAKKPSTAKKSPPKKRVSPPSKAKTPTKKVVTAKKKKTPAKTKPAENITAGKETTPAKMVFEKSFKIDPPGTVEENTTGNFNKFFEKAIEEGNNERNARNYTQAEAAYQRAQNLLPVDSRAIYGLGNLFSDQQRWEEAENAYRNAIKLDPNSPEAYIALSFVLTQPVVGTNVMGRYAEAEKFAQKAIELDGENAVAHDQLGVALELQGNISAETQNQYQKAVSLDPTFALAYAHLGRLLRRKGLTAESNQAYINSIQFSIDVPTMILVADVMQSQQRYFDSEQLLRRALREDPKNPTALYLLGRALTTRGSYDEAELILKKSAEISPKSFVSFTLLSSLFMRQGIFTTAENYLEEALKVVSPNEHKRLAVDFEAVGDGYIGAGKKPDAARVYQKAIKLDAANVELKSKLTKAQAN